MVSLLSGRPWGGSEELWFRTARVLRERGHTVTVSVAGWGAREPENIGMLESMGCSVERRFSRRLRLPERVFQQLVRRVPFLGPWYWRTHVENRPSQFTVEKRPDLVLISEGNNLIPREACEPFVKASIPYALLVQAASETWWPYDLERSSYVQSYSRARAVFFVSEGNRLLTAKQLLYEAPLTEVVRNPFNLGYGDLLAWPRVGEDYHLAFVGRLEPDAKGLDILLDVFAEEQWRRRNVRITLYGDGVAEDWVRRYAKRLHLDNVSFAGFTKNIRAVWEENHALVLPSRIEGLPLAIVEAMLAGRVCIVTEVGGNAELIEDDVNGFVAGAPTRKHYGEALERAWSRRDEWEEIGRRAAAFVRTRVPPCPEATFADRLLSLCGSHPEPG